MKICVMGNSHVGALKRAWDTIKNDYPEHKITFFAARGGSLNGLIVQEGKLIPNTKPLAENLEFTAGKAEIDPKEFDVFLIYGLGLAYFPNKQQFYSKTVLEKAFNDFLTGSGLAISLNLLINLRGLTDKPIFIGHCPLRAAKEIQLTAASPDHYLAGVKLMNDVVYSPLDAALISQPPETIANGRNTHPDFSKGSKRLEVGDRMDGQFHPEDDMTHMNDKFGEIWLKAFFKKCL